MSVPLCASPLKIDGQIEFIFASAWMIPVYPLDQVFPTGCCWPVAGRHAIVWTTGWAVSVRALAARDGDDE